MDNYFIYNLCQYIVNEEQSGNGLSPEEFNRLLRVCSQELTRQVFRGYEEGQEVTDNLRRFKRMEILSFVDGEADLPSDYYRKSFLLIGGEGEDSGDIWVEFCDDYDFGFRQTRTLTAPSEDYPIARVGDGVVEILPVSITSGDLYYLKEPDEPLFDYYYDTDGRIVFFEEAPTL